MVSLSDLQHIANNILLFCMHQTCPQILCRETKHNTRSIKDHLMDNIPLQSQSQSIPGALSWTVHLSKLHCARQFSPPVVLSACAQDQVNVFKHYSIRLTQSDRNVKQRHHVKLGVVESRRQRTYTKSNWSFGKERKTLRSHSGSSVTFVRSDMTRGGNGKTKATVKVCFTFGL